MKIDPYKHKERYNKWKESGCIIKDISETNSTLIVQYVRDMELGINVSAISPKGARSFIRLITIREKMAFFAKKLKELYSLEDLREVKEEQLMVLFAKMRNGEIRRFDGKVYQGVGDYVRIFKAFWHWHQKVSKKQGKEIRDITCDLDSTSPKPRWVYMDETQLKKFCEQVKPEYKTLIMFLFDSGIRAPTELVNIKVSDFFNDFKEVMISEEASKTFGRRIKLMICPELIKSHVRDNSLAPEDYIFPIDPRVINQYLKRVAKRVFGDEMSQAGQKYSDVTLYDFRHISCCYWLPRYKSESALKYRFGWKKSDKIHYYSELLGMKDTISEEDLLVDVTKTEIEQRLTLTEKENILLKEQVEHLQDQMGEILKKINLITFRKERLS